MRTSFTLWGHKKCTIIINHACFSKWEWCWSKRSKIRRETQESDSGMGPERLRLQHSPPPVLTSELSPVLRHAQLPFKEEQWGQAEAKSPVHSKWKTRTRHIFSARLCRFSTYTVGLCRPLWSLAVGDGLCPVANDDTAPTEEDCGGGGGGGGKVSWNKWAYNNAKMSPTWHLNTNVLGKPLNLNGGQKNLVDLVCHDKPTHSPIHKQFLVLYQQRVGGTSFPGLKTVLWLSKSKELIRD